MPWGARWTLRTPLFPKRGDYVFALKGNQGLLKEDIQAHLDDEEVIGEISSYTAYDKGHGRLETRECWVTDTVEWLHERHPKWSTISCLIRIDSTR